MASPSPSTKPESALRRVLVTGAGGFLGSHLCAHFGAAGWSVAAVGRFHALLDVPRQYPNLAVLGGMTLPDPALLRLVAEFRPHLVVHAAGTASVGDSVKEPYADFQRTVDVCAFTLETLRRHSPDSHFVLLSSASVYGNPESLPVAETAPLRPISPYGFHKVMCEKLVEEYGALHGLRCSVLRIFSAYGERLRRQVVFDLLTKIEASGAGETSILGTGTESRDFIHARDVARAVAALADAGAKGAGTFNVGSGRETRISDLAEAMGRALGMAVRPVYSGETRRGDPLRWVADIGKIARLGFAPATDLDAGLAATVAWLRESARENRWNSGWVPAAPRTAAVPP